MSIVSRIKAGLAAIGINFKAFVTESLESFPELPKLSLPPLPEPRLIATRGRSRIANSNKGNRIAAGLPHGTSGAKLIRRAAAGRIGK